MQLWNIFRPRSIFPPCNGVFTLPKIDSCTDTDKDSSNMQKSHTRTDTDCDTDVKLNPTLSIPILVPICIGLGTCIDVGPLYYS